MELTREQIVALWDEHQRCEFELRDVETMLATMSERPHILNVPDRRRARHRLRP